jgi:hypothetical protein
VDNLGANWVRRVGRRFGDTYHYPAEYASAFGCLDVLRWLWVKGALLAHPRVGWQLPELPQLGIPRGFPISLQVPRGIASMVPLTAPTFGEEGDVPPCPFVILAAAQGGHAAVVRFLVQEVGIPLSDGDGDRLSALHVASSAGQDGVVAALLELGVDAGVKARRVFGRLGVKGRATALAEAAAAGCLACVRVLAGVVSEDDSFPSAMSLAAAGGHVDIVRCLLGRWPAADSGDAFSLACVLGNTSVIRLLRGRSTFCWSTLAWGLLWQQPSARIVQILDAYGVDETAVEHILGRAEDPEHGWRPGRLDMFVLQRSFVGHVPLLASVARPTRELAECMMYGGWVSVGWEECSVQLLRNLRVRASRVLPLCAGRMLPLLSGPEWGRWERILGPIAEWDVDAYERCQYTEWGRLVRAGAPVRWARHADGSEYLEQVRRFVAEQEGNPRLQSWGAETLHAFMQALKAVGVDLSRHHFCARVGECTCGYQRAGPFRSVLAQAGATPCDQC